MIKMIKKIFCSVVILMTVLAVGYNAMQQETEILLSDMMLDNVEALASGENPFAERIWRVEFHDLWSWTCYNGGSSYCPRG